MCFMKQPLVKTCMFHNKIQGHKLKTYFSINCANFHYFIQRGYSSILVFDRFFNILDYFHVKFKQVSLYYVAHTF